MISSKLHKHMPFPEAEKQKPCSCLLLSYLQKLFVVVCLVVVCVAFQSCGTNINVADNYCSDASEFVFLTKEQNPEKNSKEIIDNMEEKAEIEKDVRYNRGHLRPWHDTKSFYILRRIMLSSLA